MLSITCIHRISRSTSLCSTLTFSTSKPSEKIDYILTRPAPSCPAGTATSSWCTIESHVIPTILSDHFAVIATLVLTHP